MAGFNFNGGDDLSPIDPSAINPGNQSATPRPTSKSRQLLERYIRDFEKSAQKKVIDVASKLEGIAQRGAPGNDDPNRLQELVDNIIDRQQKTLEKISIQFDKEFDSIETRLNTQKGIDADFDQIEAARREFDNIMGGAADALKDASQKIVERGKKAIASRAEKKDQKQLFEAAQQAGDSARKSFLEENKSELEASLKEKILGSIDKVLLLGRRGTVFGSDERERRRQELIERSNQIAATKAKRFIEDAGGDADEFNYKTSGPPAGFRSMDVNRGGFLAKVAGVASIIALTDQAISRSIESVRQTGTAIGTAKISTGDFAGKALGDSIPLNVGGKLLTAILKSTEDIADASFEQLKAFSGDLIGADIDRQMAFLEQNMRRADSMGPLLADIYRSRTELEMAMREMGDKMLQAFGPLLIGMNNLLTKLLEGSPGEKIAIMAELLGASTGSPLNILSLLTTLVRNSAKDSDAAGDQEFKKELEAFFGNWDSFEGQVNTNIPKAIRDSV